MLLRPINTRVNVAQVDSVQVDAGGTSPSKRNREKKKIPFKIRIRETKLNWVQIPHVHAPSPFLPYHLSLDHGGVVMSTSPQVTMTTARGGSSC